MRWLNQEKSNKGGKQDMKEQGHTKQTKEKLRDFLRVWELENEVVKWARRKGGNIIFFFNKATDHYEAPGLTI